MSEYGATALIFTLLLTVLAAIAVGYQRPGGWRDR